MSAARRLSVTFPVTLHDPVERAAGTGLRCDSLRRAVLVPAAHVAWRTETSRQLARDARARWLSDREPTHLALIRNGHLRRLSRAEVRALTLVPAP